MKTREIRDRIKTMGFERGAVYCLEAINEELIQTRRDLNELASYLDKMTDSMSGMMVVAERMKETIDRNRMGEDELGPNTNALDKDDFT